MSKLQIRAFSHQVTHKWGWLCPLLAIAIAAAALAAIGLSFWTALFVALLLVCPALLVWGAIELRRHRNGRNSGEKSGAE